MPIATTDTSSSYLSEMNPSKTLPTTTALVEPSCTPSASHVPQVTFKPSSQIQAQTVIKMNEKKGPDQGVKKQQHDNAPKCQRGSVVQTKGNAEPIQPEPVTKVQSVCNQSKRESITVQGNDTNVVKSKGAVENSVGNQKLGKESEGNRLKKDSEKSALRTEKIASSLGSVHEDTRVENAGHVENRKAEIHGGKAQASSEKESNIELESKSDLQSSNRIEKIARMPGGKHTTENVSGNAKVEDSDKEKDCMSEQKCDLANNKTDEVATKSSGKDFDTKDKKASNPVSTVDIGAHGNGTGSQKRDKNAEIVAEKGQPLLITGGGCVKNDMKVKEVTVKELQKDPMTETILSVDAKGVFENKQRKEAEKGANNCEKVVGTFERVVGNAGALPNIDKEPLQNESMDKVERGKDEAGKEDEKSRASEAASGETHGKNEKEGGNVTDDAVQQVFTTKQEIDDFHGRNSADSSKSEVLSPEVLYNANDNCETKVKDNNRADEEPEKSINTAELSSSLESQLGVGQRRVKRRKRLISEDEEKQNLKSAKVDDYQSHQPVEDSKLPLSFEDFKPKKGRGRPRKTGTAKSESQHSSDNELQVAESSGHGLNRAEQGRGKCRNQEEPIENRGLKRQRSVGSESNASDTCAEDRDMETGRRTRRQIKPKRCYSPSDGK